MARHMMEPDPDATGPSLGTVYAVIILILMIVNVIGLITHAN